MLIPLSLLSTATLYTISWPFLTCNALAIHTYGPKEQSIFASNRQQEKNLPALSAESAHKLAHRLRILKLSIT